MNSNNYWSPPFFTVCLTFGHGCNTVLSNYSKNNFMKILFDFQKKVILTFGTKSIHNVVVVDTNIRVDTRTNVKV